MEKKSQSIEFKKIPFRPDREDLSQECTAYMKTKQFMAERIHQQQEEIEWLKQNLIFHSSKEMQTMELVNDLKEEIKILKENSYLQTKKELDLSNEDLTSSFVYEENFETVNPVPINRLNHKKQVEKNCDSPLYIHKDIHDFNQTLQTENLELGKVVEKLSAEVLEKTIELNKIKSDKFILHNELNELVLSLRKVDIDLLNSFYKKNTSEVFSKFEMPIARGIKFNILSAQSQICKLLVRDSNLKKVKITTENKIEDKLINQDQIDSYLNILKKTQEEFENLLDRKLAKRSKSFINN